MYSPPLNTALSACQWQTVELPLSNDVEPFSKYMWGRRLKHRVWIVSQKRGVVVLLWLNHSWGTDAASNGHPDAGETAASCCPICFDSPIVDMTMTVCGHTFVCPWKCFTLVAQDFFF